MPGQSLELEVNDFWYDVWESNAYYLILYGGAGSGKSRAVAQKLILRLLSERGHRILALRKVARTLENSIISELLAVIDSAGLGAYFHYSKSRPWGIRCVPTGSEIRFAGLDDREKLKSFAGVTGAWLEEATEADVDDLTEIVARIRGVTPFYKQIILTFNPNTIEHWLYHRFFGEMARFYTDQAQIVHTNYLSNAFIDDDYVRRLNGYKDTDPNYYRVYCLGEWGTTEEIIYPAFHRADLTGPAEETFYGLDFGWNSPSACVRVDVSDGQLFVSEVFYGAQMNNYDILSALHAKGVEPDQPIYCDTEDAKAIADLKYGVGGMDGVYARPADKKVLPGIRTVQEFHNSIRVHSSAVNLMRESMLYQWRRGTRGELLDEPVKAHDHALDALRYAIHSHFKTYPEGYRAEVKR